MMLGARIAAFRRPACQLEGRHIVPRDAVSAGQHHAEAELRRDMVLLGRLPEPARGLIRIPGGLIPGAQPEPEGELCGGVARLGRGAGGLQLRKRPGPGEPAPAPRDRLHAGKHWPGRTDYKGQLSGAPGFRRER